MFSSGLFFWIFFEKKITLILITISNFTIYILSNKLQKRGTFSEFKLNLTKFIFKK